MSRGGGVGEQAQGRAGAGGDVGGEGTVEGVGSTKHCWRHLSRRLSSTRIPVAQAQVEGKIAMGCTLLHWSLQIHTPVGSGSPPRTASLNAVADPPRNRAAHRPRRAHLAASRRPAHRSRPPLLARDHGPRPHRRLPWCRGSPFPPSLPGFFLRLCSLLPPPGGAGVHPLCVARVYPPCPAADVPPPADVPPAETPHPPS